MFLCHNLMVHFNLNNTEATEMVAVMLDKTDRTVRQWRMMAFFLRLNKANINRLVYFGTTKH